MTAVSEQAVTTLPGSQFPLGATVGGGGTNFAVASAVADGMVLCDKAGSETQIPRATFLTPKTTGDMRERAWRLARRVAPVTGGAVVAFAIWTHVTSSSTFFLNPIELLAMLAVIAAVWLVYERHEGLAFAATTVTMASCIVSIWRRISQQEFLPSPQRGARPVARRPPMAPPDAAAPPVGHRI
jgi:Cytochrome bd terminal oxidase subunit II